MHGSVLLHRPRASEKLRKKKKQQEGGGVKSRNALHEYELLNHKNDMYAICNGHFRRSHDVADSQVAVPQHVWLDPGSSAVVLHFLVSVATRSERPDDATRKEHRE